MEVLSGVSFDLGSTPNVVRATACVESHCEEFDRLPDDDGRPRLLRTRGVMINADTERDAETRLTVVDTAGRRRTFRTTLRLTASEPNGRGCGTSFSGDVRLDGASLRPVPRS